MMSSSHSTQNRFDLQALLQEHFDPKWGSPYWLSRKNTLSFDPRKDPENCEDLVRFGPFPEGHLRNFPVSEFVPRRYHSQIQDLIYSETGGTTGMAKGVYFSLSEFRAGFIDPFVQVCQKVGWPQGEKWLFLGPTGPHIIGKVLDPICRELGSPPPFKIDFDPRWSLKLTDRSLAKIRYLEHVVDQAVHLLEKEGPRILFGSPKVLLRIAERMECSRREEILGVHYGGTSLSPELYRKFREELFPSAIHLSGYGNSLVGVAFEAGTGEQDRLNYFSSSPRHRIRLVPLGHESLEHRMHREVAEGETGQVVVSRLDSTFFIPNLVERDQAEKVIAPEKNADLGWSQEGVHNPRPISEGEISKGALY